MGLIPSIYFPILNIGVCLIEVGLTKKLPSGKKTRYKYSDVEYDPDGWASLPSFYPLKFDLVNGKTLVGKIVTVWWTGLKWMGLRLQQGSKIVQWKRILNERAAS
jgi:hypothetical protein